MCIVNHPFVRMFYLPTYSPEYNPIERFWEWLKSKVYGFGVYNDIGVTHGVIRKFLWDYREGRLYDTIKFRFSCYKLCYKYLCVDA